jgi:surfactin synthase thioesterase subunit
MATSPWLVGAPLASRKLRLYCFSYAGGGAHAYAGWQAALGPDIEVCAIQLPGRGARMAEAPFTSMQELVFALTQVLTTQDRTPFAFFGHSMGALVAFELARFFSRHSLPLPRQLIVSGATAPQRRAPPRNLHLMPDAELIAALHDYDGSPPSVLENRELMELLLPMIRADFELVEKYVYRPGLTLSMPLTVLLGKDDSHVTLEHAPDWKLETRASCDLHTFDGGHFFLQSAQDAVFDCLRKALQVPLQAPA